MSPEYSHRLGYSLFRLVYRRCLWRCPVPVQLFLIFCSQCLPYHPSVSWPPSALLSFLSVLAVLLFLSRFFQSCTWVFPFLNACLPFFQVLLNRLKIERHSRNFLLYTS